MTDSEKKRKERRHLKRAGNNQKKQKVLESFIYFSPAASLTAVDAVEMVIADDLEPEAGKSAAARIATELRCSAECMMLCDNDVVSIVFFILVRCVLDRKETVLEPLSSVLEHNKGIEFCEIFCF